jgi:hypothetical protein
LFFKGWPSRAIETEWRANNREKMARNFILISFLEGTEIFNNKN